MFQDAVGAFVRDPQAGLTMDIGWPMYHAKSELLRESNADPDYLPGLTWPHC
jgi:hypothetical protein